jgi:beta-phosphoglucomutase family hydrolase
LTGAPQHGKVFYNRTPDTSNPLLGGGIAVKSPDISITPDRFDAVMFDLDGVLTSTARIHAASWKQMFDDFLADWEGAGKPGRTDPFELHADYLRYVDGKPRYDGVRSFLASRGIDLPEGTPDDPPDAVTIGALGNRKDALVNEAIAAGRVEAYPESTALVEQVRARGLKTAVVSSSRHCRDVLRAARLAPLFDAVVDGNLVEAEHLAGKPAPDTFLRAAQMLGIPPERAVVIEDAGAGVQAGHDGRFGLVIGIDRGDNRDALLRAGADRVVSNLGELLR